jgi:hypothetical protein
MKKNYLTNTRESGNPIKRTEAEIADWRMKKAMKNSGFEIVDENDRVTTIKDSIKAFKHDQKQYNALYDNAVGNMKKSKLPTR